MSVDIRAWCVAAMHRKIQRRDDTPSLVIDALGAWFDGGKSAMRRFLDGEPISARGLISEIGKCRAENLQGDAEAERLRLAQVWAINEDRLASAVHELSEATDAFTTALVATALEPYLANQLFRAATGHDLPRDTQTGKNAQPDAETVVETGAWIIRNTDADCEDELFWSNTDGWAGIAGAAIFTSSEHQELNLPLGGEWIQLQLPPRRKTS